MRILAAVAGVLAAALSPIQGIGTATLADRVIALTRDSKWISVSATPLKFRTYHPQGLVKVRDTFFVSSVEVTAATKPLGTAGRRLRSGCWRGVGHLFKFATDGTLIADLPLGEGAIYHPGGIDYDGEYIWVPVAEYRPDSRSIVYRVDPASMKAVEILRFADHIGAIVHNTTDHTLHGVGWGSRRFYRWALGSDGRVTNAAAKPESIRRMNPSHYVDYQDCKYAGLHRMLCTGVTEFRQTPATPPFRLGGTDLVDLVAGRPIHQAPLLLWTAGGIAMTQNPAWIEPSSHGLRGYFMPEDDASTLYVYEVDLPA